VIPSLPGFGFSCPVAEAGWDTARTANAWAELMRRLGYRRYGVQGGDLGAAVSPEVGRWRRRGLSASTSMAVSARRFMAPTRSSKPA
jgi:pimeloyl-ACP methyl ester carboxylesterase